jgi:transposase InsO family protein
VSVLSASGSSSDRQHHLAAVADTSISDAHVARELDAVIARRGTLKLIVSDHRTEFTSNAMLAWAREARRSTAECETN